MFFWRRAPRTAKQSKLTEAQQRVARELDGQWRNLDNRLWYQGENGLYDTPAAKELQTEAGQLLDQALTKLSLDPPDLEAAYAALRGSQRAQAVALASRSPMWRLNYVYGVPHLLYLLAWMCLLGGLVYALRNDPERQIAFGIPALAVLVGALGTILQAMASLVRHVNRFTFRKVWATWFLACPAIGALVAVVAYVILQAVGISGFESSDATSEVSSDRTYFFTLAVSFVAGYKWEWVFGMLERIQNVLEPFRAS